MVAPLFNKDLSAIPISDRVKVVNNCVTLYPDIPKEHAFREHYTSANGL